MVVTVPLIFSYLSIVVHHLLQILQRVIVDWNGTTYTTSGSYTFTTTNSSGCDSTATLNLTINSATFIYFGYYSV